MHLGLYVVPHRVEDVRLVERARARVGQERDPLDAHIPPHRVFKVHIPGVRINNLYRMLKQTKLKQNVITLRRSDVTIPILEADGVVFEEPLRKIVLSMVLLIVREYGCGVSERS